MFGRRLADAAGEDSGHAQHRQRDQDRVFIIAVEYLRRQQARKRSANHPAERGAKVKLRQPPRVAAREVEFRRDILERRSIDGCRCNGAAARADQLKLHGVVKLSADEFRVFFGDELVLEADGHAGGTGPGDERSGQRCGHIVARWAGAEIGQ